MPQPSSIARAEAQAGRTGDLDDGARDGDGADRQQVLEREMQAHAEHQQDDADLAEFLREALVGNETGRIGADDDAGDQVADQRRHSEAVGDQRRG
jgi:hypothetical protein